ncbi:MAG: hypothetical protein RI898_171 [Actinomycetota bacterium]
MYTIGFLRTRAVAAHSPSALIPGLINGAISAGRGTKVVVVVVLVMSGTTVLVVVVVLEVVVVEVDVALVGLVVVGVEHDCVAMTGRSTAGVVFPK